MVIECDNSHVHGFSFETRQTNEKELKEVNVRG